MSSAAKVTAGVSGVLVILILAAVIAINVFVARAFRDVARMKGHKGARYFWIPFLFGFAGWILVLALPDRLGRPALNHGRAYAFDEGTDSV